MPKTRTPLFDTAAQIMQQMAEAPIERYGPSLPISRMLGKPAGMHARMIAVSDSTSVREEDGPGLQSTVFWAGIAPFMHELAPNERTKIIGKNLSISAGVADAPANVSMHVLHADDHMALSAARCGAIARHIRDMKGRVLGGAIDKEWIREEPIELGGGRVAGNDPLNPLYSKTIRYDNLKIVQGILETVADYYHAGFMIMESGPQEATVFALKDELQQIQAAEKCSEHSPPARGGNKTQGF